LNRQTRKWTQEEEDAFIIMLRGTPRNKWEELCEENGFNLKRILRIIEELEAQERANLGLEKRDRVDYVPSKRESIHLGKLEPVQKAPQEEPVKPEDDKDSYQRAPKPEPPIPEEPEKVKVGKAKFGFTKELVDLHVNEKEVAIFECVTTHKNIPVQWFVNNTEVIPGPK